ncbi:phosphatidylinositol-glycan biosynthesis class S protein [Lentinula raphanica]|nr:phosphatidylinositol-glycan biosynthesis class S protein [Lentinula raphanica]
MHIAPLAFEPQLLSNGTIFGLTPENLTVFINSAEWTLLSNSSNDPVLYFILFITSAKYRPLVILNSDGIPSASRAFLVPQWGHGIVILDLQSQPPSSTLHLELPDLRTSRLILASRIYLF